MFFELIRIALGEQQSFSRTPSAEDWADMYALAARQGIAGVLSQGIGVLPKEQLPPAEILADWITLVGKVRERNLILQKQADYATRTFLKHGFRSIIIKGQSLAGYYPQPELRHSNDIDIWLEGSKEDIVRYVSSVRKPDTILYHHCDFKVIKGTSIEVHFTPSFFANPFTNRKFQRWAKGCGNRLFPNCDGIQEGFNSPDSDFSIPYLLIHFFRHLIDEELEIKPVIDYYYLLKGCALSDSMKQAHMRTLRSFGLGGFTAGVMYLLNHVCGLDERYLLCSPDERHGRMLINELFKPVHDRGCLTEGKAKGNHIRRFFKRQMNLVRFISFYPKEIIWSPYWTIKIYLLLHNQK